MAAPTFKLRKNQEKTPSIKKPENLQKKTIRYLKDAANAKAKKMPNINELIETTKTFIKTNTDPSDPSDPQSIVPPPPPYTESEPQPIVVTPPKDIKLMDSFMMFYHLFGVIALLLVIVVFFMTLVDMLLFWGFALYQKVLILLNPNYFNKNSMEFNALRYAKYNASTEPYTFYAKQTVISMMFRVFGFFIIFFVFQICIFVILRILAVMNKIKYTEDIFTSRKIEDYGGIIAIGIMAALAYAMNAYYNSMFLKKLQPDIITISKNIENISEAIYNNLTTNETFLENVLDENTNECIRMINARGTRYESVGSMIFTMSLYNYFKMNIASNNAAFANIRKIFTIHGIRTRDVKAINYMYFNQNLFITDLFPSLEDDISGKGKLIDTKKKAYIVQTNSADRIRSINKLFTAVFGLPTIRSKLGWYICTEFIYVSVFTAIIAYVAFYTIKKSNGSKFR